MTTSTHIFCGSNSNTRLNSKMRAVPPARQKRLHVVSPGSPMFRHAVSSAAGARTRNTSARRQLTSAATKAQIIKSPSKTNKHKSADKKIPLKNNNLGAAKIYCLTWARRIDLLTKLLWLNVIVGMEALTKMSRSTR